MNLLYDTNILAYLVRQQKPKSLLQTINPNYQKVFVSIVTIGELKSISLQNNWGAQKLQLLNEVLDTTMIVEINESLTNTYAEVDAFSQCRNPSYKNSQFSTPRNRGKNDLWIASTAALLGLKLITADRDFDHLHQVFLEVGYIKSELLK